MSGFARFGVGEVARLIAERGASVAEIVAAQAAAMEADEAEPIPLRAILARNPFAAQAARALDELPPDAPRGPLHGVTVAVKDNLHLAGLPTTSGCRAMARATPLRDAEAVRRLKAAGAVILAKTNLSEFSFEIRSRSSLGGDVRNPYDRSVSAGGSSGGSAAAVAAGMACLGLGTDTGGSIRVPAAFTGLVGVRPSLRLVDPRGAAPLAPSTDAVGVIAAGVDDAARMLAVIAGRADLADPLARPPAGVRLGVLRRAFGEDEAVQAVMEAALERLGRAGAVLVDPVALPEAHVPAGGAHVVDLEFAAAFDLYLARGFEPGTAPPNLAEILASGEFLPDLREPLARRIALARSGGGALAQVLEAHAALARALDALFEAHALDALVHPTSRVTPTSLDNPAGGWAPELAARSGRPALTLPAGVTPRGMPVGLELLGRPEGDAALLSLALGLEGAGLGCAAVPPPPR